MKNKIFNKILFIIFGFSMWAIFFVFGWYSYRSTDFYVAYWDVFYMESLKDYNDLYEYIDNYDKGRKWFIIAMFIIFNYT